MTTTAASMAAASMTAATMTVATTTHGWSEHLDTVASGRLLRVVNYHNTPASSRETLRAELAHYAERFDCLTLDGLDAFYATGRWPGARPVFAPVFYEGYRNSVDVAAAACDELGLVGWFPVCTGFVDCPVEEQELFARSHHIGLVAEELHGGRLAMTWDEIGELARRHVVFPHTASHVGVADLPTDADLEREIVEPSERLTRHTGLRAAAFAWLHGTPWGGNPRQDAAVVAAGYRYLFSNTMIQRISA